MTDSKGNTINIGDKLKSEYGYEVIVYKTEDGELSGKLICDDSHSCKNIPYSLNNGKGYIKIN